MTDKKDTKKQFSKEHLKRRAEREKRAKKLRFKRFFSFRKKRSVPLSVVERKTFLQKQALYCHLWRSKLEEKIRFVESINSDKNIPDFRYRILQRLSNESIKQRLEDGNELELYIEEIVKAEQKAIGELKKKHDQHMKDINSEEFQRQINEFETVRFKKLLERKRNSLLELNEFELKTDTIENKINIKKKGYRKSEKLVLANIEQTSAELDKLIITLENSKNLSPDELKRKTNKIDALTKQIEQLERDQISVSKSFGNKSEVFVENVNLESFGKESINSKIDAFKSRTEQNKKEKKLKDSEFEQMVSKKRDKLIKEKKLEEDDYISTLVDE